MDLLGESFIDNDGVLEKQAILFWKISYELVGLSNAGTNDVQRHLLEQQATKCDRALCRKPRVDFPDNAVSHSR